MHGAHHVAGQQAGLRHADEHVRAADDIGQRAGLAAEVRDLGHLGFDPVHVLRPAGIDRAHAITERHVARARAQQQLADGNGGRARAGQDDLHILEALADHAQRVCEARERDDGRAVLVVVKDRNVAQLLELALDLKAARRGDVLQIDAAEAAGEQVHRAHELVHILRADAQRKGVHVRKRLEQHALALHDGHTRLWPDVAKAEHGRTVRDDGAEIVPARERVALVRVALDLQTRLGHAGRICERQVVLCGDRHAGVDFDLAAPLLVQTERFLCVIHAYASSCFGCTISSGRTQASNSSAVSRPSSTAAALSVWPVAWACFAIFAAFS